MASDVAIILGESPFCSPYKLWQRKLGLIEEEPDNQRMAEGRKNEPIARDLYNKTYDTDFQPAVVQSEAYEFLGASLDGYSAKEDCILEIKCGESSHRAAQKGEIPAYYRVQMQMQMYVANVQKCVYLSFYGSEKIIIEVSRDPLFVEGIISKLYDFFKKMTYYEAPALSKSDYRDKSDDKQWNIYSKLYKLLDEEIKEKEKSKEKMRLELITLCGNENTMGNGIKIQKTVSKGRIDYKEVVETMKVSFDEGNFRKEPTTSWRIYVE